MHPCLQKILPDASLHAKALPDASIAAKPVVDGCIRLCLDVSIAEKHRFWMHPCVEQDASKASGCVHCASKDASTRWSLDASTILQWIHPLSSWMHPSKGPDASCTHGCVQWWIHPSFSSIVWEQGLDVYINTAGYIKHLQATPQCCRILLSLDY